MVNVSEHDCIICSTADWDAPYWTNKQHMAMNLAASGWRILYIESLGLRRPKLGSQRDWSRIFKRFIRGIGCLLIGPKKVNENIWIYSPLVIPVWNKISWIESINNWLIIIPAQYFIKTRSFTKDIILWTYHPYVDKLAKAINPKKIIYHCVDDLGSVPGIDSDLFQQRENSLLNIADCIFTTSPRLQEKCSKKNNNCFYFPNVVDQDLFKLVKDNIPANLTLKKTSRARVVYHGVLSKNKINMDLLHNVIKNRQDLDFYFIGEEPEGQHNSIIMKLKDFGNCYFLGYLEYKDLPYILCQMNVGILPSTINTYTESMFPMKFYEYIGCGLPVVSTDLNSLKSEKNGVERAATDLEFSEALTKQIKRGRFSEKERMTIIGKNTWQQRTKQMLDIIRAKNK